MSADREALKKELRKQQQNFCIYCDKLFTIKGEATLDHIVPGFGHRVNYALCCPKCNGHKSDFYLGNKVNQRLDEELVYRSLIMQLYVLRTFINPLVEISSD